MKVRVSAEPAESSRLKPRTSRGVLEKFLRWLGTIGRSVNSIIKHFSRRRLPASQFTAEQRADCDTKEAEAVATPTELTITKTLTVPITAGVKVDTDTPIDSPPLLYSTKKRFSDDATW
jgi:hypothetical protein